MNTNKICRVRYKADYIQHNDTVMQALCMLQSATTLKWQNLVVTNHVPNQMSSLLACCKEVNSLGFCLHT